MNIFLLDYSPETCAQYHCDKHVVKMIVEYAQLLSTGLRLNGYDAGYKTTHKNHPSAVWTRASLANWIYVKHLALCLCKEYSFRYDRKHKTQAVIESLPFPERLPRGVLSLGTMPQCMPEQYKVARDPVSAYRNYYANEKIQLLSWKKREEPPWISILKK